MKIENEFVIDDYWRNSPELIKRFLEMNERYKLLCSEIEYIMRKLIVENRIEIAHVNSRAKTLDSFLEKLSRKYYDNPFDGITDFAGVRVVCLYRSDIQQLEQIVNSEFEVIEKVDKLQNMSPNEFGYGAIHFVVKLGKNTRGARYDDLKNLLCEIQIRTVLQDAWAIIDHHLAYKQESDVPSILIRKLNGLSGLFETADDSFDNIRNERDKYLKEINFSTENDEKFLMNEINRDTLVLFLKWKFPEIPPYIQGMEQQLSSALRALRSIKKVTIETLSDLNAEYNKVGNKADELSELLSKRSKNALSGSIRLKYSLALLHDEILDNFGSSKEWVKTTRNYKKNIEQVNKPDRNRARS